MEGRPGGAALFLSVARLAVLRDWFARAKAEAGPFAPEGVDEAAVAAVPIAGREALAGAGDYAGLSPVRDSERIAKALGRLAGVFR